MDHRPYQAALVAQLGNEFIGRNLGFSGAVPDRLQFCSAPNFASS